MLLDRRELLGLGLAAAPALLGARPPVARARTPAVALVTADHEAHVAVVAVSGGGAGGGRVTHRIRTVEDPRSIQSAPGGRAVVTHGAPGAVSLLDGRARTVRRVLRGFGSPRYAAIAPGGRLAYVSDAAAGELVVVDLVAGRVTRRVGIGDGARHLTLHPAGHTLWVALGSSAAQIAVVDVRDPWRPRPAGRIAAPFLAHDVAFSPSGRRVWVTAGRVRRIAVFGAASRDVVRTLGADAAPQHVTFGPDVAYVASGDSGSVRVHTLRDGHVRRTTRVPVGSYNVQRTGGRVVTPSLGTGALTVLDAAGRRVAHVHVASAAHDACLISA
jgi:DNA-binding beta-propeller fold protein YncE